MRKQVSSLSTRWKWLLVFAFLAVALVVAFGISRSYLRGGKDFSVFYEAWRLVLAGRGMEIYHVSPDRFLYSPGFAWVLSPLGGLSFFWALSFWNVIKIFCFVGILRTLTAQWMGRGAAFAWLGSFLGVLLISRPLLIDFEYGQVNLIILASCIWALLGHFEQNASRLGDILRWTFLSFIAFGKIYPLPLLLVPWFVKVPVLKKGRYEKIGVCLGAMLALGLPVFFLGAQPSWELLQLWVSAVAAKGLPLESHNQSFVALLHHYFSGEPTRVISEGGAFLFLGSNWLTASQVHLISLAWISLTMGFTLGWIICGSFRSQVIWAAVTIGLLIVPSHLVWKPYFVLSLPAAVLLSQKLIRIWRNGDFFCVGGDSFLFLVFFLGVNFTGFDFLGHRWAPFFEASSLLLILHLALLLRITQWDRPDRETL